MLDEEGRPDFGLLQQSLGASGNKLATVPPTLSSTVLILFIWTAAICAVSRISMFSSDVT